MNLYSYPSLYPQANKGGHVFTRDHIVGFWIGMTITSRQEITMHLKYSAL